MPKGQGKTKGAVSFLDVTLGELMNNLKNPMTHIPISRRYAEMLNLKGVSMKSTTQTLKGMINAPAVVVTDFNKQ